MTDPIDRARRVVAAAAIAVLAGAAATGSPQAVDRKGQAQRPAPEPSVPQDPFVGDVSAAFQQLGMAPARADCYGEVLLSELKPRNRESAVALLRASEDARDVRRQVTAGGLDVIRGFRAANRSCPTESDG